MKKLTKIDSSPWDFTLYIDQKKEYIIKVMFSEGIYKVDVARYFSLTPEEIHATKDHEKLVELSKKIRDHHSLYISREISPSDITLL